MCRLNPVLNVGDEVIYRRSDGSFAVGKISRIKIIDDELFGRETKYVLGYNGEYHRDNLMTPKEFNRYQKQRHKDYKQYLNWLNEHDFVSQTKIENAEKEIQHLTRCLERSEKLSDKWYSRMIELERKLAQELLKNREVDVDYLFRCDNVNKYIEHVDSCKHKYDKLTEEEFNLIKVELERKIWEGK